MRFATVARVSMDDGFKFDDDLLARRT